VKLTLAQLASGGALAAVALPRLGWDRSRPTRPRCHRDYEECQTWPCTRMRSLFPLRSFES
jgi:hypothetical protein